MVEARPRCDGFGPGGMETSDAFCFCVSISSIVKSGRAEQRTESPIELKASIHDKRRKLHTDYLVEESKVNVEEWESGKHAITA